MCFISVVSFNSSQLWRRQNSAYYPQNRSSSVILLFNPCYFRYDHMNRTRQELTVVLIICVKVATKAGNRTESR